VIVAIGRKRSEIPDDPLVRQIPFVEAGRLVTFERDVSILFSIRHGALVDLRRRTPPATFADA